MPFKEGTIRATGGSLRTTWRSPPFSVRLAGFAVAVVAVASLIVWFDTDIWRAQARLQEGFGAIKAEQFYFGVNFRVSFRKLTATLLDFRFTGNAADLGTFHRDAGDLNDWLRAKKLSFVAPGERTAFARLESAYDGFLAHVAPLLTTEALPRHGAEDFKSVYSHIRENAEPVLRACDEVVEAEHSDFDVFVHSAEEALVSLQRLFLLSLLLLVGLAAALAVLVYRGMITPLQARLTESHVIIERQEKLAALGALGAGVAHEIRNPLTAIKFRLFSLKNSLPAEFADNEDAHIISEELNRLDRIVKDFLQFARPSEPELVRVPAERLLVEVRDFLQPELERAAIGLKLEVVQPAWILADSQQLKQVLINLIQNSAESIRKNGGITLRLKTGTATLAGTVRPAVVLSVTDTGRGIPSEVQRRLFDPFFTTKQGGTGLGLAIAARIVEKHGGLLRYRTELNQGTTFEIVLPGTGKDATKNSAC